MTRDSLLERLHRNAPLIAPSLLKCDFANLAREIELLEQAQTQVLHWDVMDGHFVPNLTYGPVILKSLRDQTNLIYDAHLMISDPEHYLDDYLDAGCDCITVHIEALDDPSPVLKRIRAAGAVSGLSLNPDTPVFAIEPYLADCDMVLVMSVNPGFGGQKFMPGVLEKLEWLKQQAPHLLLSIDGGIAPNTIPRAAAAGAELFVVGSAIFDHDDYTRAIETLVEATGEPKPSAPATGEPHNNTSSLAEVSPHSTTNPASDGVDTSTPARK